MSTAAPRRMPTLSIRFVRLADGGFGARCPVFGTAIEGLFNGEGGPIAIGC